MFFRSWTDQKPLWIDSCWLEQAKRLDAHPKTIQQVEFVGQLKNEFAVDADCVQSMFLLKTFEKTETRLKFSRGSVTVL